MICTRCLQAASEQRIFLLLDRKVLPTLREEVSPYPPAISTFPLLSNVAVGAVRKVSHKAICASKSPSGRVIYFSRYKRVSTVVLTAGN